MRLYLVRHAESTANVRGELDTALPGPPLTDLGREQAGELARRLRGEPVVAVYASAANRAQQTAAPLGELLQLPVGVVDGVQEVFVGDLEGRSDREAIQRYLDTVRPWLAGELGGAMPGGESGQDVHDRYLEAVAKLRAVHDPAGDGTDPDAAVVLVSHGGAIRLAADWLCDNVRPEVADRALIPNTGVVALETRESGWHCLSWAGQVM